MLKFIAFVVIIFLIKNNDIFTLRGTYCAVDTKANIFIVFRVVGILSPIGQVKRSGQLSHAHEYEEQYNHR